MASFEKNHRDISKMMVNIAEYKLNHQKECTLYKKKIDRMLSKYRVIILKYPQIRLQHIINSSYGGKRPFKSNGDGYKDYIIWKSISDYINAHSGIKEVCILTGNVKDFCEAAPGGWALHRDLRKKIKRKDIVFFTFEDLHTFVEKKISPRLDGIPLSKVPRLSREQLVERASNYLEESLYHHDVYGIKGLPFGNDVTIDGLHELTIEEVDLRDVDGSEIMLRLSGTALLEASGFMEKSSYYLSDNDENDIYVVDPDWNDHVMAVSSMISTPIEVIFYYSKAKNKITASSFVLPEEVSGWDY